MKYDVVCIGMALVDSIIKGFNPQPVSSSGYLAVSGTLNVGGEAVNEAMAAAKLGMRTGILCALGEDVAGEMVTGALRKCGVDTNLIVQAPQTPVSTMFVREDGSRKSITNVAHRYNFHPERYTETCMAARSVILGSLFRAPFDDPDIIYAVLSAAKKTGQITVADTKLPNFRKLSLDDLRDSLPLIDCITPNEDEATFFSGRKEPEEMADAFLERGVKKVIIKLGEKGCLLKTEEQTICLPGYRINAVDATGAGDNFVAGFVSESLYGRSDAEALRFANACGAICATSVGAATALKNRDQVRKWMEIHGQEM